MEKRILKITCNRNDAEELVLELQKYENVDVSLSNENKNLEGLSEIVSLLVGVTSITANALNIWVNAKKRQGKKIEVEENKSEK